MIVFVKNEKGVCMPMYLNPQDKVTMVWSEICYSEAISENQLKGKSLFSRNGTKLDRSKTLEECGIEHGAVVLLLPEAR
ncbi:hypothetical protein QR680_005391 [Steinernema hermaphroditum]|uniref:Ubiquitin-like domain-containing protein n=1 Tax=Steinernema hermaphroditum TaxID=289476 RepID=A0AA39LVA1_9BILA|nr:hypothetical protein QR680_005391 [Steinernema hermaphroditum]